MSAPPAIRLRRLSRAHGPTSWRLDGTAIVIHRFKGGWAIGVYATRGWGADRVKFGLNGSTERWLIKLGLRGVMFVSRAEAIDCLRVALATAPKPPPPREAPVALRRIGPGQYANGDRFVVRRSTDDIWKWIVEDLLAHGPPSPVRSLSEAAHLVADQLAGS
jgi:hypothetical protein